MIYYKINKIWLNIFVFIVLASCSSLSQNRQYDKRLNCLEIEKIRLSKSQFEVLKKNIRKFYDNKFSSNDLCFGQIVADKQNSNLGLYRGSLFHPHFPNFYFIKIHNHLEIVQGDLSNNITYGESADIILDQYKSQLDSATIIKIKHYFENIDDF